MATAVQQAAALLATLQPDDITGDDADSALLREHGMRLFGRMAVQQRYGSEDVVAFLKEQAGHRRMLYRLEKLQKQIAEDHERRCKEAREAGINKQRQATLDAIEASLLPEPPEEAGSSSSPTLLLEAPQSSASALEENGAPPASLRSPPSGEAPSDIAAPQTSTSMLAIALTPGSKLPPRGSFRRCCGVCKKQYDAVHHFYHALCPECAALNYEKRLQSADMSGMVAVVTGGRVRIGYEIVLKLLRAGAHVVATSRYPSDAASRFAREADFGEWRHRLEVAGPLELANVRAVEAFCHQLTLRFPRIHVLINNAAQTLTRPAGWHVRMDRLEATAEEALPEAAREVVWASRLLLQQQPAAAPATACLTGESSSSSGGSGSVGVANSGATASAPTTTIAAAAAPPAESAAGSATHHTALSAALLADFPEGKLDETRQPLDLSADNSWSRRLGEVPTVELLHTLAANAVAPFILCSALRSALAPDLRASGGNGSGGGGGCGERGGEADGRWGHIINVSALEGKFSVGKKSPGHPHTNMAKASLNMLTLTSSGSLFQERILVNAVDTGWVTDMAPGGIGAKAATHETHVGPPLDAVDGAARVLDPIFSHLKNKEWAVRGKFWKDYMVAQW